MYPTFKSFMDNGFDTVIDVRSPAEFAEDHIPGAINLPVLDNAERARVGTIYRRVSPFRARKLGAALVFRNAAAHIEGPLADKDGAWRPLVYCWRGGQRSGTFAWLLSEIGWRAETIPGGYKTYRRRVAECLYDTPLPHRLLQLGGYTGTAKTQLLGKLAGFDVQTLDLEGLAGHRGSLLGDMPGGQPSQKAFESALALSLARLDPSRPVIVEAESSKIGALNLPPSLWEAMKSAPWFEITAPIEARARYLADAYDDILSDPKSLQEKLAPLRAFRGHDTVDRWNALSASGAHVELCKALAAEHYDPAYDKSMQSSHPQILQRFATADLSDSALDVLAERIAVALQTISI